MRKMWIVFRREYLIRVRKRTFILATILVPLAIAALGVGSAFISMMGAKAEKRILVKDDSGIFEKAKREKGSLQFSFSADSIEHLKETYASNGYDLLLYIPAFPDLSARNHGVTYYAAEKPSITFLERVEWAIGSAFREYKIDASQIDRALYESFKTDINLESITTSAGGDTGSGKMASILGTLLGAVMGILMYMVILIYGQMVMRSVMEEKISRIAEVMISSVKPFQLMLGKILGVGAVGLTQLAIWMILIPVVMTVISAFLPGMDASAMNAAQPGMEAMQQIEEQGFDLNAVINEFFRLNWLVIIPSFVIFFLGGFFIYSSLFAAIGSAVNEDLGEAQQFMLPVMLPVILAFVIAMSSIENPNSSIAVFGSIFPLTSPVVMPTRLPFDPPLWHVLLSLVLLILTTLFFVWLSARIYRVGILMYGKKVNFKELGRWLFYR
ncbi:MAG TPA: ABC transporter permease [Saprospiraceae bacterium]|nr:ABC transporter permease [Saprospiraceae bacterium]